MTFTALLVICGIGLWWGQEQRRTRAEEERGRRDHSEREVQALIEDAVSRYGRARGADRDPTLWAEAKSAARLAAERAAATDAPPEVRERVQRLIAEIDRLEKNRRLVATLLEIQASMGDDLLANGNQNFPAADVRYEQAFREYGADLFRLTPEQGAELLGTLGDNVSVQLASALDDWGYVRFVYDGYVPTNAARESGRSARTHPSAHLFEITSRLDPDPLRNRIRKAAMARDKATVQEIARALDPSTQPVQTVNLVAVYLFWFDLVDGTQSQAESITFLRKAHPYHSGDFQICHNLAFILNWDSRYVEALPYCTAAIAIRPRSAAAWFDRAKALAGMNSLEEATFAFQRVFALSPQNAAARLELALLLARKGDPKGALAECHEAIRIDPGNATAQSNNMRNVLRQKNNLDRAVAALREAIRLDPNHPHAHCSLGLILRLSGRFADALPHLRSGHELGSKQPGWPYPSAKWVTDCEQALAGQKAQTAPPSRPVEP